MAMAVPIRLEGHTCEVVGTTLDGHVVGVGHNGLSGLTNRFLVQNHDHHEYAGVARTNARE